MKYLLVQYYLDSLSYYSIETNKSIEELNNEFNEIRLQTEEYDDFMFHGHKLMNIPNNNKFEFITLDEFFNGKLPKIG